MSGPSQGLSTGTSSLLTQVTPAELQQLFNLSPDALVVINRGGMVTGVNRQAEELFGYSSRELVGRQIEVLLPQRLREIHIANREHFFSAPQPRSMGAELSLYGRRKDATEFPVDISLKPVSLHHELHVIGSIRDMTVQKRLEEQSRLKSQFLANMSHELRTPLTSIIGFADLLRVKTVAPETQKEYLEDILASARHQLQLVNDILDLSKVEAGQIVFQPEPVDIAGLITEVQMLLRPLIDKKHLQIETALASSLNEVILDPTRLKQLLLNYLSNAIKFTDEGGTISIRIKPEDPDMFLLEVEDTGIGIRPEDLGRLFAVFQQLDGGMGKQYQGTGLGLALSKHLVEAQGGSVGVKSTSGQGSTFFAVLPRVFEGRKEPRVDPDVSTGHDPSRLPGRTKQSRKRGRSTTKERASDRQTILVVEDDPAWRKLLTVLLKDEGYDVHVAVNAEEAQQLIAQIHPQLTLMDIQLPGMDGLTLTRLLKADPATRQIPVVALTAYTMKEDRQKALDAGCDEYLAKPIERTVLLSQIEQWLQGATHYTGSRI